MKKIFLDAITSYHPDTVLENSFFEKFLDTTDEWIRKKVGISQRRWMSDYDGPYPVFEIGRRAVEKLVKNTGYDLRKIDLIISCSSFEDIQYPGPANLISEYFKMNVPAFHLKNGCSTVLYAIEAARGLLQLESYRNILLVNGEPFTRQADYSDRTSCILFGDASSAMVVSTEQGQFGVSKIRLGGHGSQMITSSKESASLRSIFKAAGTSEPSATPSGHFQQRGKEVYDFVVKSMPREIRSFLGDTGMSLSNVDYFIGHQANMSILESIARELQIPPEKHLWNIDRFGNVSSAGWVTVLSEGIQEGRFKPGSEVLVSVFGAGMAWGTLLIQGAQSLSKDHAQGSSEAA
jgi:3-oxoacyl-[acyl-carrier-protein] synthase-3